MSFLMPKVSQQPKPTTPPPAPRISDAQSEGAAREERSRARKRRGVESTILTGLGSSGGQRAATLGQTASAG